MVKPNEGASDKANDKSHAKCSNKSIDLAHETAKFQTTEAGTINSQ